MKQDYFGTGALRRIKVCAVEVVILIRERHEGREYAKGFEVSHESWSVFIIKPQDSRVLGVFGGFLKGVESVLIES